MEFVVKDERVDNQKSKQKEKRTDGRTFAFGGEKRNRTARGRGKQLLRIQKIQKNAFLWKSRQETVSRRAWLRVSQS